MWQLLDKQKAKLAEHGFLVTGCLDGFTTISWPEPETKKAAGEAPGGTVNLPFAL
jgi:hypothetical protein